MHRLKIGVELASLRLPFRKGLELAAELGADAVEIDARGEISPQHISSTGVREIRKLLENRRLRVAALAFRTRAGYATADGLEQRIEATQGAMRLAHSLGATVVVNQIGRVPADPASEAWRLLTDVLADLGRYGHQAGALLAAETGTESGEQLARLVAALPEHSIGVDLNPGRLLAGGFSAMEAVRELGKSIVHVHATDAVRDLSGGRDEPVVLGRGAADFPALLAALEEFGYCGCVTVQAQSADDPAAEIAEAIKYLRGL